MELCKKVSFGFELYQFSWIVQLWSCPDLPRKTSLNWAGQLLLFSQELCLSFFMTHLDVLNILGFIKRFYLFVDPSCAFHRGFLTTWFIGSGVSRSSKVFTWTIFSCQRRVAQLLMCWSGAYPVTGTQTSRAVFLTILDAYHVAL